MKALFGIQTACIFLVLFTSSVALAPPGSFSGYHWLDRAYAYADTYWDGTNSDYAHREPYPGDGGSDLSAVRRFYTVVGWDGIP
jgi:hypothetical protein